MTTAYDTRLATWISAHVDRRLRLTAALRRASLCELLNAALDQSLPSADELAQQMQGTHTHDR
jgi:hypothetical protein